MGTQNSHSGGAQYNKADVSEFDLEPLMQKIKTHSFNFDGERVVAVYSLETGEMMTRAKSVVNSRVVYETDESTVNISASHRFASYQDLKQQIRRA